MKFCKYCGVQIEDDVTVCPSCQRDLTQMATPVTESKSPFNVKKIDIKCLGAKVLEIAKTPKGKIIGVVVVALVLLVIMNLTTCNYAGCNNRKVESSDYCYSHKCAISDCNGIVCKSTCDYCYSHALIYAPEEVGSSGSSYGGSSYVSSSDLSISNVYVGSNSSYTYAEGTITNNSDVTVSFVQIKGSFETSYGTVVDTDWTYAVGSEGLAPGESCKWRMSVDKDYSIDDVTITILDFDY